MKKGNLCYFTTCVDEITTTCSKDGKFNDNGFPINECKNISTCEQIKHMNTEEYRNSKKNLKLAEMFIKEPLSLEILLMILEDKITTLDKISNVMETHNKEIIPLLNNLQNLSVIDFKNISVIKLTDYGKFIVSGLLKKINR